MAVVIKHKSRNEDALDAVGLGIPEVEVVSEIIPHPIGSKVQLIAKTGCWKYVCKTGDIGVVTKIAKASSIPNKYDTEDLYFVKMDRLLETPDPIVYLTYSEIIKIGEEMRYGCVL